MHAQKLWVLPALACVAAIIVAGCGGQDSPSTSEGANSGSPAKGGQQESLTIALAAIGTEALDPLKGPNNNGVYLRLMFDPLVGVDRSGTEVSKETGIAEDWTISQDGKTYTFTLRKGVKFHDGTELTSADVAFSLGRLGSAEDLTTTGKTIANQIDSIRAKGDYEVELKLNAPTATLLYRLSPLVDVAGLIVSKAYYDEVGDEGFDSEPVGSGPYRFVDHKTGSSLTFEAVDEHWAIGVPRYRTVEMRIVPEESSRVAMLRSGEAQFIDVGIEQLEPVKSSGNSLFEHAAINPLLLFMNLGNENSPLDDIDARKALSYAIDREGLNEFLFKGLGQVTGNIFPSQLGGAPLDADPFDIEQAKAFLADSPYGPGGETLTLELNAQTRASIPQMLQVAQTIQSDWEKIGVKAKIEFGDYATWRTKAVEHTLAPNAVDLLDIGGRPDNSDTSIVWLSCEGLLTQACDPKMDRLATAWSTAQDDKDYETRAREAEAYARDQYLVLPVLGVPVYYAGDSSIPADYSPGAIALGFHVTGLVWSP